MSEKFEIFPIAFVRSEARFRAAAPRQAVFAKKGAFIEFIPDARLSLAAKDLEGFERIWLIGCFHLNLGQEWKAKVRPPVSADGKRYGVFSTRAPHRPNALALSCVKLLKVTEKGLLVGPCDLLDGTPIFDIKPYLPEADAFPNSKAGWRDAVKGETPYKITFARSTFKALAAARKDGFDLRDFARLQLSFRPLDKKRKRLKKVGENYLIACTLWRLLFSLDESKKRLRILKVFHAGSNCENSASLLE